MQITTYKELEWYIINETDKEKLLFLRDSFTNEQILKYFLEKKMIDEYCDVIFNSKQNPWWDESDIRNILNTRFLNDLDINDLNKMKTTLELNGKTRVVEDYVRLITKEEVRSLPTEVLKTERTYGYWTMSPYYFGSLAIVFSVIGSSNPGGLGFNFVRNASAVRPLISLKKEQKNIITSDQNIMIGNISKNEIIRRLKRAKNI